MFYTVSEDQIQISMFGKQELFQHWLPYYILIPILNKLPKRALKGIYLLELPKQLKWQCLGLKCCWYKMSWGTGEPLDCDLNMWGKGTRHLLQNSELVQESIGLKENPFYYSKLDTQKWKDAIINCSNSSRAAYIELSFARLYNY